MNYAFLGTPKFAVIILEKLIRAGFAPSLVICNPDRPVGRKKIVTPPPTKLFAQENDIKVYQPHKLDVGEWKSKVGDIDFAVVAAYGKIIPKEIIETSKLGFIGVHPSLLPKYRGPTPIRSAILTGEEGTGVVLFLLDEDVDHGPIFASCNMPIAGRSYSELEEALAREGASLLIETLPDIVAGKLEPKGQDHEQATHTVKFTTNDSCIDYAELVTAVSGESKDKTVEIERIIRALNPEPGVWTEPTNTELNLPEGMRVKLLRARTEGSKLILKEIQVAGKTPQPYSGV